jgi:hypothetical protein
MPARVLSGSVTAFARARRVGGFFEKEASNQTQLAVGFLDLRFVWLLFFAT